MSRYGKTRTAESLILRGRRIYYEAGDLSLDLGERASD